MRTTSGLSLFIAFFFGLPSSNVHGLKIPFEVSSRGPASDNDFMITSKLTFAFGDSDAESVDNKKDIRVSTHFHLITLGALTNVIIVHHEYHD